MAAVAQRQGVTDDLNVGDGVRITTGLAAGEMGHIVHRFDMSRYLLVRFHRWASDWEFLYLPEELEAGSPEDGVDVTSRS